MMKFEDCMVLTRTISSPTAFEDNECRIYFNVLRTLAPGDCIVEIGLQYGRSSSIALQLAKERNLLFVGIDPFENEEAYLKWTAMADGIYADDADYELWLHRSGYVANIWGKDPIQALLIDGDHRYEGVLADCKDWLPKVANGGFAMFHDYGRESLPGVTAAVDEYFADRPEWRCNGVEGTLAVWIKNE